MKFEEKQKDLVSLTRAERRAVEDRDYLMRAAQGHFRLATNDDEKRIAAKAYVLADIGPDRRPLRVEEGPRAEPEHRTEAYSGQIIDSAMRLGAGVALANDLGAEAFYERQWVHDAAHDSRDNPHLVHPSDLLTMKPTYLASQVVAQAQQLQFPEITHELAKLAEPQQRPSVTEQIKTATREAAEKDRELTSIMRKLERDQTRREQTGPTIPRAEGRDRW